MKLASEIFPEFSDVEFQIYAGPLPDNSLMHANLNVRFMGIVNDLPERMKAVDLVLGGGRVALEAMSVNTPVMAVGQKCYVGFLDDSNINKAKRTNFGDMHETAFIDYEQLRVDLAAFVGGQHIPDTSKYQEYLQEYELNSVVPEIRAVYQSAIARKQRSMA